MGQIGALTSPTDGAPPASASEPWEFIGDVALPIDRDISRFADTRAGKIANELQKMFQVLGPGRSKRGAMFAVGTIPGGLVGVVLTYGGQMLLGQPGDVAEAEPPQPDNSPQISRVLLPQRQHTLFQSTRPSRQPTRLRRFYAAQRRPCSFPRHRTSQLHRHRPCCHRRCRGMDAGGWKEIHVEVISISINALCSPGKFTAAEAAGKKPLDLIDAPMQLTWPTETDFITPSRLRECPVYPIPT